MRLYSLIGLSLLMALPVAAQDNIPSSSPLTVDEAVRLAVQNHPRLTAATRDVGAATLGVRSAKALTNPNAIFSPGITSISGVGEEFLIQQPLEVNGTRSARTGIAQAELRGSQAQAVVALREVVSAVKTAYYELERAREQRAVAREAFTVAQEFDRIARRQVELGSRPGIDLAQTGLEVARAERAVTLADGQVIAAQATLNTALGRKASEPVGPLTPLPPKQTPPTETPSRDATSPQPPTPTETETDALMGQSLAARAEIQVETATGDRLQQEARLIRAEGKPDIAPQFRVGYFTRGLEPTSSGNGAGIGVAITLPLFDYGSRSNRLRQVEKSAEAQEARITAAQNEVRLQVVQAAARLRAAEAVVTQYQGGVLEQAKRLLDGSRVGFQEGRTSVVALLEAQRSYRSVQNEYINALADAAVARVELERATGAIAPSLLPASRP